jgi:hypothetical protein
MDESMTDRHVLQRFAPLRVPRRIRSIAILVGFLEAVLAHGEAFAQRAGANQADQPRLDLGLVVAAHGAPAELSLTLRVAESVKVGKVEAELRFPPNELSFFAPRPAPKGVKLDVTSESGEGGQTILKIVAQSPDAPIPPGVLTTLVFNVGEEATEEKPIDVPLTAKLWAYPDTTQEITPLQTRAGRVTIQAAETLFACFFYMH